MPQTTRQRTFRRMLTVLVCFCVVCSCGIPATFLLPASVYAGMDNRLLQIKAAFTYRFLLFSHWPDQNTRSEDTIIRIGVVDNRSFATLFEMQAGQGTDTKSVEVVVLDYTATAGDFRRCQILYIPDSSEERWGEIREQIDNYPVLTVSDMDSFLERGGMISLYNQRNRVRFSVNLGKAQDVGIHFNAQMLKLASRVVEAGK